MSSSLFDQVILYSITVTLFIEINHILSIKIFATTYKLSAINKATFYFFRALFEDIKIELLSGDF